MPQTNTDLELNFSICEQDGCRNFSLVDTTKIYNVITNPGGWTDPNPELSEVDTCTLDIELPDDTVITLNILTLFGGLIPNLDNSEVVITATDLGLSDKLPDGIYKFTYTCTGSTIGGEDIGWISSTSKYFFFTCQTQCRTDKMFGLIKTEECSSCKDTILKDVINAQIYIDAAHKAAACTKLNMAEKLLARANFIASKNGCSSC